MTTLTILPNYDKKKIKCFGTIAAGEHVAVTVTDGAQWLGSGSALRLRVLFGPTTVGVFPAADADEWSATGTQDVDAYCELNLNTVQAEKLLKFGGTCLFILDDIENHTLYATGEFDVLPWPKRRGMDEPIDLDDYPQLIEDMEDLKEAWIAYQATINAALDGKAAAVHTHTVAAITDLLDGGKIKSDLLPSYVDDVMEYDSVSAFPATGESGKIYVAKDTNKTYRWSGTTYVEIAATPTLDDAVTRTSANGVKSSGIWAAIWGALAALPTGFSSLYDWCVEQLSGKASTADATLTERGPNHDGFSAWTIKRAGVDVTEQARQPEYLGEITEGLYLWRVYVIEGDDGKTQVSTTDGRDAVFLEWSSSGGMYTATRTALSGYQLGSQSAKPIASEAEAEALRQGKQDALSTQQLANIADVPNKADAADLRYSLNTATVTPGSSVWTANYSQIYDRNGELVDVNLPPEWGTYSTPDGDKTGWFWVNPDVVYELLSEDESATSLTANWQGYNGEEYVDYTINFTKTTTPATVTNVKDRAINAVALSGNATLTLPSQVSSKSRDFFLSVANNGSSNATVTVSGAVLIDSAMNAVTLVAKPSAITTWRLTEMVNSSGSLIPATFIVTGANQLSSLDVIDPATATASGKAADALATKNALAAKQNALTAQQLANIAAVPDKLDATSAAPAFSTSSTYAVDERVTYNGKLYKCTTAVTTAGAWDASKWTADTMTDPDAVIDITAQNQLRVVAKDGTVLWAQGYDLASTSSATLACDAANNFTFANGATTQAFALPTAPTGKVGDFGLDVDNSANASAATMTLTGLDTTFSVVVPKGESLTDMLSIAAGELAQFYVTLSTFRVNNLPTWHIVKQIVENGGAQS